MSAAISGTPAIALSWGLMSGYKPPSGDLVEAATKLSCQLIEQLWEVGFGEGHDKVDLYSVNIPVSESHVL
jgi:5'/3'-nucleotidase SurE